MERIMMHKAVLMMTEYESILKGFLPVLRSRIAVELNTRYGLKQTEIAALLEVTQAEVSKYLNGTQPKGGRFTMQLDDAEVKKMAKLVLERNDYEAQKVACRLCPKGSVSKCSIMIK